MGIHRHLPAGTMAELTNVSLDFAAPEVVRALEAGKTQMKVEPSQDVWALGMVAYELLTRSRAFPSGMAQQVRIHTSNNNSICFFGVWSAVECGTDRSIHCAGHL